MNLGLLMKSVGPVGLGGGIGVGGVALYKNTSPESWRELLEREGVYLINSESDYKAIFYDQSDMQKTISDFSNETNVETAHPKIKNWCDTELAKKPENIENDLEETKQKLVSMCSHKGIISVKARIVQAGKTDWISDQSSDTDDKYKDIFAIYKYYPDFLAWLNEDKSDSDKLQQTDKASEKHSELKNKCDSVKKQLSPDSSDHNIYRYTYWWCQKLPYSTVKERIKKLDESWEERTSWNGINNTWGTTEKVVTAVKGGQETDELTDELTDEKYKTWCTLQLGKKLHEDDVYQDNYLIVKSVCREEATS